MALKVTLTKEKETKNTVRFQETSTANGEPEVVGSVYVQKWAWTRLGNPDTITVTVDAVR